MKFRFTNYFSKAYRISKPSTWKDDKGANNGYITKAAFTDLCRRVREGK